MLRISTFIISFFILLNANYIEHVSPSGFIDWSKGKVYAKGYGVANPNLPKATALFGARRAALVDARRNLLETIGGVRIDSETIILNKMTKSDKIRAVVSGVVKNSFPVNFVVHKDNSVEALVEAPLEGSILDLFYPKNLSADAKILLNTKIPTLNIKNYPLFATYNEEVIKEILKRLDRLENAIFDNKIEKKIEPTGIIIDARGTNFIPSLKPKVYQIGSNKPIYPDGVMMRDDIVNNFSALFTSTVEDAKSHPRVAPYPLVIKALKTYGKWRNCIVLGKSSSKKFKKYLNSEILKAGKVIIVISR